MQHPTHCSSCHTYRVKPQHCSSAHEHRIHPRGRINCTRRHLIRMPPAKWSSTRAT
ncbi:uncharacterized protein B0I36DRAFT_3532 [Microdochium trichocladiopsis]|uniref:Uncharacterized protein n=1 Tax=Microdochium trichocladiopsis TaxID=1682393 RepID=A0A9P9BZB3_9PEZI|nr:uncharacterized protein B0I36DRAFT_3532 [Microdochium trichocladiopsis]KAH7039929.1 hypothetical protein B0I36DRAFT_3532 [Microdochium trichocladiopsis]